MDYIDHYIEFMFNPSMSKLLQLKRPVDLSNLDISFLDRQTVTKNMPLDIFLNLLTYPNFRPLMEDVLLYAADNQMDLGQFEPRGMTSDIINAFICKRIIMDDYDTIVSYFHKYPEYLQINGVLRTVVTAKRFRMFQFLYDNNLPFNIRWMIDSNCIDMIRYTISKNKEKYIKKVPYSIMHANRLGHYEIFQLLTTTYEVLQPWEALGPLSLSNVTLLHVAGILPIDAAIIQKLPPGHPLPRRQVLAPRLN
jgi:hypothetical protein